MGENPTLASILARDGEKRGPECRRETGTSDHLSTARHVAQEAVLRRIKHDVNPPPAQCHVQRYLREQFSDRQYRT